MGIGVETEGGIRVRVRVRVGIGVFFDKALEAERAERIGFIGDGDSPSAHVAKVRLSFAGGGVAGRHGFPLAKLKPSFQRNEVKTRTRLLR